MARKACFFIGHRDSPDSLLPSLLSVVEKHITQFGAELFIVGNYGRFDRLAAEAVILCKEKHPDITLLMLLQYHPSERSVMLSNGFDGSFYPSGMEHVPRRIAIVKANQYAVDYSDFLISFFRYSAGNTARLLEYARRRERQGKLKISVLKHFDTADNP